MYGDSPAAQARRDERARCAAIVMSAVGLKQPQLAYAVAFKSRMTVAESLAFLETFQADMQSGKWAHLANAMAEPPKAFHRGARVH